MLVKQADLWDGFQLSSSGCLLEELKDVLRLNFHSFKFCYVPRKCNSVVHALAAWGNACDPEVNPLVDELPSCIMSLVASDSATPE